MEELDKGQTAETKTGRSETASSPSASASGGHSIKELARRNDELDASNRLNETIIESINHPLAVVDKSLRIIRCNRRFRDIFQPGETNGLAKLDGEPLLTSVFSDDRLKGIISESMASEDTMQEIEFSCHINGIDEERHFLLAISRFKLPSSPPSSTEESEDEGILMMFDEITEWRRRQFQVMEASRLVSIGEMAAGIAHEINNPLAAVMGFAQLAMRRNVDDSARKDLDKILTEAKRASKIITNLQSFARRYKPRKEPVNVIQIVEKVLNFRSYEFQVSDIEVVTRFNPDTPIIMGDEHQLDQVFFNIVINAEQVMVDSNGGGILTIEAKRVDGNVHISFTDDGPGISSEDMPKIFDPFFTTKEVGKGTGLGLSICYGIIHEHGGKLLVDSTPGQGATFTVQLPVADSLKGAAGGAAGLADLPKGMKVLIVDDEPLVAEFLLRVLDQLGHSVEIAERGAEVVQKQDLDKYDLIILDIKMPGLGGDAVFEHIKQYSEEVASRVLFITGDTTNPSTRAFVDSTDNPILTKPFTIEDLLTTISRLVLKRGHS